MKPPRRSPAELAAHFEARAAEQRARHELRLSIASDNACSLLYDAEKIMRDIAAYFGQFKEGKYLTIAEELRTDREQRWADLKSKGLTP